MHLPVQKEVRYYHMISYSIPNVDRANYTRHNQNYPVDLDRAHVTPSRISFRGENRIRVTYNLVV